MRPLLPMVCLSLAALASPALAQNEAALTSLDRTTTALADVPFGQRPEDADEAMIALEALADRARTYAGEDR